MGKEHEFFSAVIAAESLGITRSAFYSRAVRLGIKSNHGHGYSVAEIKRIGKLKEMHRIMSASDKAAQVAHLKKLLEEGMNNGCD